MAFKLSKTIFFFNQIFKASALWADAFYNSICLCVCPSVRVCVFTFVETSSGYRFKPVLSVANAQRQSNYLGPHDSSTCTVFMPCTGFGKVFNNSKFLPTSIWSKIDSQKPAQGVEMSIRPRLTIYAMHVNIIKHCVLCIV